jgi:hypothetical protein
MNERRIESVVRESEQNTRFPNAAIADEEKFKK